MCAMSPDWPTLSAFQLPCFCNSEGCRELQPWARISERLRRWLGPEPALAWPRTGVSLAENRRWLGPEPALAWPRTGVGLAENRRWLGPETVVGRLKHYYCDCIG